MEVSAKDKATNKSQSIKIEGSSGLSKEEIEKMKEDAKQHQEDDKKKKDLIEQKNIAEGLIFQTEKTLKEAGDKIDKEKIKEVEDKLNDLKKVKDSDKIEEVKQGIEGLNTAVQKVSQELYQAAQASQQKKDGTEGSKEEPKKDEKPEEGEYHEKSNS